MYVRDYPEQLLVTCCKNMSCLKCDIDLGNIRNNTNPNCPLHDLKKVLDTLAEVRSTAATFTHACAKAGIKPVIYPFWEKLLFVHIFHLIAPVILHQLH